MPVTQSKEVQREPSAAELAKRQRLVKALVASTYLSVCQHVITLQSETMMMRELCNGNVAETTRILANTTGLVGLLGLFVNQAGGKLTDAVGRRGGIMLGPLGNLILGQIVFRGHRSRLLVSVCRVLRMAITTFSNTVVISAMLSDQLSGQELAMATSKILAVMGLAVITAPVAEVILLRKTPGPRFSFVALSMLGGLQLLFNAALTEETLPVEKRIPIQDALSWRSLNPFGFTRVWTEGSKALQKMAIITSLQMALEGKNVSDIVEIWKREHMKWGVEGSRNFLMAYGSLVVAAGALLTPALLRSCTPRGFTSLTNFTNFIGFVMRGALERPWCFILACLPMLPGVNGSSASALKALMSDRAAQEGFGMGEFSAWQNNLRAIVSSIAPIFYGNYYAWAVRRGVPPGTVFWCAALVGALLPEVLLRRMTHDELRPVTKDAVPKSKTDASEEGNASSPLVPAK